MGNDLQTIFSTFSGSVTRLTDFFNNVNKCDGKAVAQPGEEKLQELDERFYDLLMKLAQLVEFVG